MAELGENVRVELPLERDDQARQVLGIGPAPRAEFRVLGVEVDVFVAPGEAHQEPFLALPVIAAAPYLADQLAGKIVAQPAAALGDDRRLVRADLLL